jgi:hypothetical protein
VAQFIPQHTPDDLDGFVTAYLEAAEWLLPEENEESGDPDPSDAEGFSAEAIAKAIEDCRDFRRLAGKDYRNAIRRVGYSEEQAGHDFWLTRNGHGAGFWDRGALDARGLGDALSDHAKTFGTSDVYIGDDMRIHLT